MKKLFLFLFLCSVFLNGFGQKNTDTESFKIAFYNVENYFDCVDDSLTNDSEFTPQGSRYWNFSRYKKKQSNIAKVISSIGGWEVPALVGLCEIENRGVLIDLTKNSPLKAFKYNFVHKESPDARGIDVALLYQPNRFRVIREEFLNITFPDNPKSKTRDILYATGIVPSHDTLHVFVCHFPSRLGGELESESRRLYVAWVVRAKIDSLFSVSSHPNIVVMGDFNDYPTNRSILEVIKAKPLTKEITPKAMYNLFYHFHEERKKGTHKFAGEWGVLDQLMVSGNLLNRNNTFYTQKENARIYDTDFLLEDDKSDVGKRPFRNYVGFKYNNGFSDHLPIIVEFNLLK